jgi:hypothetical protein
MLGGLAPVRFVAISTTDQMDDRPALPQDGME